ncbi:uncharacterized protein PG998_002578 [Apiospora kogelbergensis]|uniref:uncharacterized protein n=1 Tax=Apiospora kogelbergensis TaxID=1337665 RepID=UPI00312EC620
MNIRPATVASTSASDMSTSPGPTPETTPPPLRVLLASASESFVMGVDTCGFTSGSTLTCSAGYCTNIGDHRGCCTGAPTACSSSIWTTCRGFTEGVGYCGAHTLCCSAAALPACVTYYFTTDRNPGVTFTNVGCGTSAMYGQMYPFPPELMPTTSADDHASATELAVNPIDTSGSSADKSQTSPTGAIVGAIAGGVLFLALALAAFFLLTKRRRRLQEQQQITKELISGPTGHHAPIAPTAAPEKKGSSLRTRLRLSTIPEQHSPLPKSPLLSRYKSSRRSYGPDWPLGSADPLESHPVLPGIASVATPDDTAVDLEKRLSEPRGTPVPPQLQIPAIPATRLSPAPPPKSPSNASPRQLQVTPSASSADIGLLQSPRLSFAPPASPIDAAFNAEVARRVSLIDGAGAASVTTITGNNNSNRNSSNPRRESKNIRISTKPPPRNSVYQQRQDQSVSPLSRSPERRGSGSGSSSTGVVADPKRLSLVSEPSIRDSRFYGAADDLVSPVSPEDEEGLDGERGGGGTDSGQVSPATISPMESRRGSLDE